MKAENARNDLREPKIQNNEVDDKCRDVANDAMLMSRGIEVDN